MIPIQDLLNRIRWDEHFGGAFVIGYYDRVRDAIVQIPFSEVSFPLGDHFAFELLDEDGVVHSVPYHRVRQVFRNGELIWQRDYEASGHA